MERQPSGPFCVSAEESTISGFTSVYSFFSTSTTATRSGTPTCVAASPTPGAARIVSTRSAMSRLISLSTLPTFLAFCRTITSSRPRISSTATGRFYFVTGTLLARRRLMPGEWAFDRLFDSLVRELVQARAADVEMASTARRDMADIKKEERSTGAILERQAGEDRAPFAQMLEDAVERSGEKDVEVSYDSADENQDRQAELI